MLWLSAMKKWRVIFQASEWCLVPCMSIYSARFTAFAIIGGYTGGCPSGPIFPLSVTSSYLRLVFNSDGVEVGVTVTTAF